MKILIFLLAVNLYHAAATFTNQIHHSLNEEQLGDLFNVKSHAEVPEYEVIRIHSRSKRSANEGHTRVVQINAFGSDKTLVLKRNEALARKVPVFFADPQTKGSGIVLTRMPDEPDTGTPYQDEANGAAVMVHHDPSTGDLLIEGTIGEDLVVRPVPAALHSLLPPNDRKTRGREDEANENVLEEDVGGPGGSDGLFMDQKMDDQDLVFSDGLPFVADDEFVTGESVLPKEQSKGNNVTKETLPEGLLLLRKRRSPTASNGLHVIYKRKLPVIETDYAMMEMDKIPLRAPAPSRSKRSKREAPYVIYPEILVLVDYDGYLLHGQDNSKIKSYYVSFWNGVDLRYKLLKNPRVKVSIAGIIISRSRDAMPYLERNRVGRDAIDSASALTDMGKYLYQERRLPTYDIAVAITKLDMCRRTHKEGKCNRGTAGFAYVGGACVVNKRLQKVNSVAIVEDTGGFSGIIVAAHEVGHLLGAVHDGSPPPSYLGGPGARHCKWKDGYIMSDLRHTERGFRWSQCSIEQFHHFLNGETATCLYNLPHEDEALPRVLPGKLLTLDAQCKKDRGTTACFKDERVCAQLFCFDSSSGFCVSYRPAAEGSDCGSGKICLNGKCVYDNENSISDVDIHRPEDNFLYDSTKTNVVEQSSTPVKSTTQAPLTTKRWGRWRKNNNSWKQDKHEYSTTPSTTKATSQWSDNNRWKQNKHDFTTTPSSTKSTTRWSDNNRWKQDKHDYSTTPSTTKSTTRRSDNNRWKQDKHDYSTTPSTTKSTSRWSDNNRWKEDKHDYSTTHRTTKSTTRWSNNGRWKQDDKHDYSTTPRTTKSTTRWSDDNKWKQDNHYYSTTPSSGKTSKRWPVITKSKQTSRWPSYSNTYTPKITTSTPYTTRPTTTSTTTTTPRSTVPYTIKRVTTPRTTRTPSTVRSYQKRKELKKPLNSIENNDSSSVCDDKLTLQAGRLSCEDFLRNYGLRYCNHRFIKKNCCKTRRELCTLYIFD